MMLYPAGLYPGLYGWTLRPVASPPAPVDVDVTVGVRLTLAVEVGLEADTVLDLMVACARTLDVTLAQTTVLDCTVELVADAVELVFDVER